MKEIKDTVRASVHIGYDGRVHKVFKGSDAEKRYAAEVKVLELLAERGCDYVPRLLEKHPDKLEIVTTNCGHPVARLSEKRMQEMFGSLEKNFGVRHNDQYLRNITYDHHRGCFCVIDFELAEVVR